MRSRSLAPKAIKSKSFCSSGELGVTGAENLIVVSAIFSTIGVEKKEGEIILKGTATSVEELKKGETLAKEVQGVKTVKVEAKVDTVKKPYSVY
ncbi:MAG: hypothetical protein V7K43_16935 [Nostoc sp.]